MRHILSILVENEAGALSRIAGHFMGDIYMFYALARYNDIRVPRLVAGGQVIRVPVAHGEGNWIADDETVRRIEHERRVIFRYCAPDGTLDAASKLSLGSYDRIALQMSGNPLGLARDDIVIEMR